MVSDRLLGALSLGLAAALATWGGPPAGDADQRPVRRASGRSVAASAVTTTAPDPAGPAPGAARRPVAASSSTTTTTTAATTTTTAARAAASAEPEDVQARRILLAAEDLPPGFVAVRAAPEGDGGDGPFERCLGPDAAALTAAVRAKARSAEFGRSGTGTVSSSSAVFADAAAAERVVGVLSTPDARSCFEDLINARLARNPHLPEDVRGTLSPLPVGAFGDQSTGFRFEVLLPAEDVEEEPTEEEIPYLADFVFVRRGRALALLEFGSLRRPFPAGDLTAIATRLAGRM